MDVTKESITRGELDRAKRRALNILDSWLETTGVVEQHSGYHSELEGIVEDAVEIGAQAAFGIKEKLDSE